MCLEYGTVGTTRLSNGKNIDGLRNSNTTDLHISVSTALTHSLQSVEHLQPYRVESEHNLMMMTLTH